VAAATEEAPWQNQMSAGMPDVKLSKEDFSHRARERFYDPSFDAVAPEIEKIM